MKRSLLVAFGLAIAASAQAATGMFGSYIQVLTSGNTVYDLQAYGPIDRPNFGGANLGTVVTGGASTLHITNGSGLTFKSGGGNVTGVQLNWRIYKDGAPGGGFNNAALNFGNNAPNSDIVGNPFGGGGDQEWRGLTGGAIDIDTLFATYDNTKIGNWKLEAFYRASTNEGDRFSNNGGANFIANFTVVPEPSRVFFVAIGLLGLIGRRRRN
jgi:hypothetical protein